MACWCQKAILKGLAAAMGRVLSNEALRRDLAARGMERARMFDVKEIAARWLARRADGREYPSRVRPTLAALGPGKG